MDQKMEDKMPEKQYSRIERQAMGWLGDKDKNALSSMRNGIDYAVSVFEVAVEDKELARPLALLYLAEEMPEIGGAVRQSAYLSAFLGFESYKSNMEYHQRRKEEEGTLPPEMERYLGICAQLSDYCRSKVDFLPNETDKTGK